jgi:hypothetical protein
MCLGGPPKDNSADIARQQEEERRARVSQGTAKIDEAFGRFDQPYYEGVGKAYQDYYAPQLDRQYQAARDKTTYALADAGALDSTAAGKRFGDLTAEYGIQKQQVADRAIGAQQDLRGNVEQNRSELVRQLETGSGVESTAATALARAGSLSAPPQFSPLGDLFQQFTGNLRNSVALQGAGYPGLPITQGRGAGGNAGNAGSSSVKTIQ